MDEQAQAEHKVADFCCCAGDPPSGKALAPQIHMFVDAHGCMLITINTYYTCVCIYIYRIYVLHTRTMFQFGCSFGSA